MLRKNEAAHPNRNPKSLRYSRKYMNGKIRKWAQTPKGRACIRRKSRKRRLLAREIIRLAKEANPCKDCRIEYPYYMMEFDHCKGKKEFNIACAGVRSITRILKEIAKCDVVCANCHKKRTARRLGLCR